MNTNLDNNLYRRRSSNGTSHRTRAKKRKKHNKTPILLVLCILCLLFFSAGVYFLSKSKLFETSTTTTANNENTTIKQTTTENKDDQIDNYLSIAKIKAASYDYEEAINNINMGLKLDKTNVKLTAALKEYTDAKSKLVNYTGSIPQVFFHELIVDPDWLFSNISGSVAGGHNSVMTTLDEFNKILEQMYEKGYILVNFNQLYDIKTDSNNKTTITQKELLLPPDKKPFIMSEDDVNFYKETRIDVGGYGQRYVLDDNGDVKVFYKDKQGKEFIGDYDVLPALETFCQQHPDFSYKGARAYIGETGWEGAFGYRIGPDNKNDPNFEANREMVKKISTRAREEGFLFASHSFAHGNQQKYSIAEFEDDSNNWDTYIGKYIGGSDTYILPKGNWFLENGWTVTSSETLKRWELLEKYGFRFICGVGLDDYTINHGDFVFMDRYNFDGFAMHNHADRLSKFFDVASVFDKRRPGNLGLE